MCLVILYQLSAYLFNLSLKSSSYLKTISRNMNTRSKTKLQNRSLIEKLPTEIHLEIFQYLDSWSIRRSSETCMTFFNVTLRHEFKEHFKLNMLKSYLAPGSGIGEVFKAKNRTVRKFTCLTIGAVDMKSLAFAKNFFMRIGKDVTELHIQSSFFYPLMMVKETENIESNLRKEMLKNFPNLKELAVERPKILQNFSYYPPSLKDVEIKEAALNHDMLVTDYADLIKQKDGTGLEKFIVSEVIYPCDCLKNEPNNYHQLSNQVYQIIDEIASLESFISIETDCNILDHKKVDPDCVKGITFKNMNPFSYNSLAKFPNLESIDFNLVLAPPPVTNCFSNHLEQRPDLKKIKSLRVKMPPVLTCNQCISGLLTCFTGLRKLEFLGPLTDTQARLIFTSMPDLEELILVGEQTTSTLFDSEVRHPNSIENLKNLKTLKLLYDSENGSVGTLSNQSLFDFANLPQLKDLYLEGHSQFSLDGIQSLVSKCPNISSFLSLSSQPFNSSMVQEIVRGWPQLHTLVLKDVSSLDDETLDVIKDNCSFLRKLGFLTLQPALTFSTECSLFENISTLEMIRSGSNSPNIRVFTRTEYYEQTTYLDRYHNTYTPDQLKRKRPTSQGANKRRRLTYTPGCIHCCCNDVDSSDNFDDSIDNDMDSDD